VLAGTTEAVTMSACSGDPVSVTDRPAHAGDQTVPGWHDFWTAVYQAIDD
jgi:hypothetical protein